MAANRQTNKNNPKTIAPNKAPIPETSALDTARLETTTLATKGYIVGKVIGQGSYAKVYLAEYIDPTSKKHSQLACKVINKTASPKEFIKKFFPREIFIMAHVNHPNLIKVHSVIEIRKLEKIYLFMQLAHNGDVLDFLRFSGPITEDQSRIWFTQLVKGMLYLHQKNIAHRDLKCENLLLTSGYTIKISDFGFAVQLVDPTTKSGTFCGSVSYAPPEIIRGLNYDPKRADLWSMGVILYVFINRAMPFDDLTLKKLYETQINRGWKIRTKVKNVVSMNVRHLIYQMLEPVPEKRRNTADLYNDPWIQNPNNPETKKVRVKESPNVHPSLKHHGKKGSEGNNHPNKDNNSGQQRFSLNETADTIIEGDIVRRRSIIIPREEKRKSYFTFSKPPTFSNEGLGKSVSSFGLSPENQDQSQNQQQSQSQGQPGQGQGQNGTKSNESIKSNSENSDSNKTKKDG